MKIDIQSQRKTCIESTPNPKAQQPKQCWRKAKGTTAGKWVVLPIILTIRKSARKPNPKLAQLLIYSAKLHETWNTPSQGCQEPIPIKDRKDRWKSSDLFRLNEDCFKNRVKPKTWSKPCSWVRDDQDDTICIPTCHNKQNPSKKPKENQKVTKNPKVTKESKNKNRFILGKSCLDWFEINVGLQPLQHEGYKLNTWAHNQSISHKP